MEPVVQIIKTEPDTYSGFLQKKMQITIRYGATCAQVQTYQVRCDDELMTSTAVKPAMLHCIVWTR